MARKTRVRLRPRKRQPKDAASSTPAAPEASPIAWTLPAAPQASPIAWTLPTDLLLEIIARSDVTTLVRCTAACKLLRREILSPFYIRRVIGQEGAPDDGGIVPPCLLAYLLDDKNLLSLVHVHPATPTAASFSDEHLAPFISCDAADLLAQYTPFVSRGGLVLLRRRHMNMRKRSERRSDVCVYDPMTNVRTFLPNPPGKFSPFFGDNPRCVLLTAADGIGCSFLFLVSEPCYSAQRGCDTIIQSASSDAGGAWGPATYVSHIDGFPWWLFEENYVVLRGGVIHWLVNHRGQDEILTYDVCTGTPGMVKLPATGYSLQLCLLADGSELRLLIAKGFKISVWRQLPRSVGGGWTLETVIDTEETVRSLDPAEIFTGPMRILFMPSGERSGGVLLRLGGRGPLFVLDMKTMEMRRSRSDLSSLFPLMFEVDMIARLRAMKIY